MVELVDPYRYTRTPELKQEKKERKKEDEREKEKKKKEKNSCYIAINSFVLPGLI